jgi:hypothetical protein
MNTSLVRFLASAFCLTCLLLFAPSRSMAQSFAATGSMNVPRYEQTATLLNNGNVLVVGGSGSSSTAELYNPTSATFSYTGSPKVARFYGMTATLLQNGEVLIVGGSGSPFATAAAELYNPATGTFSNTGSLNTARVWHTATLLSNGEVLITGGQDSTGAANITAELYNPATGTFAYTASLHTARANHTAAPLANGSVLIAGGVSGSTYLSAAELYNPTNGTFSVTGNLHTGRASHSATVLSNGEVLIVGGVSAVTTGRGGTGYTITGQAELYNPAVGSFTASNGPAVAYHTATLLNDGTVLVVGGLTSSSSSGGTSTASAELYSTSTGAFTSTASSLESRSFQTATLLSAGTVLIAGGEGVAGRGHGTISESELYSLASAGSLDPKYMVLTVVYAPPGSKSNVNYGGSTQFGTSSSITQTFMNNINQSISITTGFSIFGSGEKQTGGSSTAFTQESDTSSSVSVNETSTSANIIFGPSSSALGVDHDFDQVWIWLNPKVNLTAGSAPNSLVWNGYSYDLRDTLVDGMDIVFLTVGELKNPSTIPSALLPYLARAWDTSGQGGLTSADYAALLTHDPFAANPSYDPRSDPNDRFDKQGGQTIPYENPAPGGQPNQYQAGAVYQATTTAGQSAQDTFQLGFSIDQSYTGSFFAIVSADLKFSNTTTWMNKWSALTTNMVGQSASMSITGPATSDNYTGPQEFDLWKDNVYGTFMFYAPPQ